jgi:large subunit ribosomal protein L17
VRHRRRRGKLARPSAHRSALLRNLVTSLLDHELIETTDARAKELRRVADRMITLGKRGGLHARRRAAALIRDDAVVVKLFDTLAGRYAERAGGYTRVLKSRLRRGDAAPLSIVELVDRPAAEAKPPEKAPEKKAAEKKKAPVKKAPEKKPERKAAAKPAQRAPEKKPREKKAPPKGGAPKRTRTKKAPG